MANTEPPFPKGWTIQSNRKGVVEVHDVRVYNDKCWAGTLLNKDGSVKQQKFIFYKKDYFEHEGTACNTLACEYHKRIENTNKQIEGWKTIYGKLLKQRNATPSPVEGKTDGA